MGKNFLLYGIHRLTSNYGCEAIARGTEVIIDNHFDDATYTFVSYRNADYENQQLGLGKKSKIQVKNFGSKTAIFVDRVLRKLKLRKPVQGVGIPFKQLDKTDCVLCVGGDLYTFANKETGWEYPWIVVDAGNRIMDDGHPFVIWCASVGPFDKAGDRLEELLDHLRRCTAIVVREPESYKYLTETLSSKENVFLAADPAYLMEPYPLPKPMWQPGTNTTLAVNLSAGCIEHVFGKEKLNEVRDRYIRALSKLVTLHSIDLLIVPHVSSDHQFLKPVYELLRKEHGEKIKILPPDIGSPATKWAISNCDVLLTMRFHCALAGIGTCTPTIILLSTDKGRKLASDVYEEQTGNLLSMAELTEEKLIEKVLEVLNNKERESDYLAKRLIVMKNRSISAGKILKQVLDTVK